ncbi:gfo/Idh/MocA family oxidoreductase [candidate division KSB3 bacterium]|uniref:Gfo/Idh/MocA family oxidoreductase n=1 Tax=candidate division KSB3 bacterium TaxID=2044937 RepID=A0A9D5JVU7_9BACT|nr:gfo/Idh/MocA family oxidoreductase [candidate division KSB3 bacterium]MBD3324641.1 gfo/Idh/MocA family oxidoreductase [candidate division KSB3 bacterium]
MPRIKVGVIGLGSFAHAARLPVLASLENIELTACMVRTQATVDRVARQFGFHQKYTDVETLIAESGIDAAFVITPKQTHYEIVKPLLEHGIHVFCEKPMAMSLKEAQAMVDLADQMDRLLMIGFNRRYAPVYERAKAEFADHPPDVCVAFKNRPGTEYRATMENAIHMVDLLRWFCGECVQIEAHAHFENPDYETTAGAMLRFASGTIGFLLGNRTCGQWMERVELYGDGKTVTVNCPDSMTVVDHEREHTMQMTPLRMGWATLQEKMGFRQEVVDFFECLKTGNTPRTTGRDVVNTHILLNEILRQAGLPEMES